MALPVDPQFLPQPFRDRFRQLPPDGDRSFPFPPNERQLPRVQERLGHTTDLVASAHEEVDRNAALFVMEDGLTQVTALRIPVLALPVELGG